jgi:AhpD family alkylhydroperoxidase
MPIEQTMWEPSFIAPVSNPCLESSLRKENGGLLPPGTRHVIRCPWLARSVALFNWYRGRLLHLDINLAEMLALAVSQDNSCRYCFAVHRILTRFAGMSEPQIRRFEQELLTIELPQPEQRAIVFARRLSRSTPIIRQADLEPLAACGWSDMAIREMALVCGAMVVLNRYATFLALDPESYETLPDRWYVRLIRPALGFALRLAARRGDPAPFSADERQGPFARIVNGFDGLPLGRSLRTILDEAWHFDGISRRTKALVVAVIARGLGDDLVLSEARALALDNGVGAEDFAGALAHFSADGLTEKEKIAIEFARDTIWYAPAPMQRRTRAFMDHFETEELLDLVGFASLANLIARLGIFAAPS